MPMNDLMKTELFVLINENSHKITNEQMQNAYGKFVEQIRIVSDGNDYSTTYRILVVTRIELASLETSHLYGQEKKCV